MKFGPDNYNHEERCSQGHSSASTIATIEAALSADPDIDSSAIEIRMLGPVVLLEGFITKAVDRDKAISLAAMIVGWENVQDRMLSRFPRSRSWILRLGPRSDQPRHEVPLLEHFLHLRFVSAAEPTAPKEENR
jgi:hypothetical protein